MLIVGRYGGVEEVEGWGEGRRKEEGMNGEGRRMRRREGEGGNEWKVRKDGSTGEMLDYNLSQRSLSVPVWISREQ